MLASCIILVQCQHHEIDIGTLMDLIHISLVIHAFACVCVCVCVCSYVQFYKTVCLFNYLAALGLSCSIRHLPSLLQPAGYFVFCFVLFFSCSIRDLVP